MGFGEKRQKLIIHDVKYDHENGRFTITDRILRYGQWENTEPKDITTGFRAIFDLGNAELAWFRFISKQKARAIHPVKAHEKLPKKPYDDCSKKVRTLLLLDDRIDTNERLRAMMTMSAALWDGLEGVYSAYQREAAAHPGQLPIIECVGVVPMWNGTTMQPQFAIVGWVDRPAGLPDAMPYTLLDDEEEDHEANEARSSASASASANANGHGRDYYDQEIPF
jgi:hypothetical protein